ncbi:MULTISPECIES: Rqc2 family fibronectin-binding protein [Dethiosulfovibrio]|uniref:NFACT family protein n=2 Tax=Dethiosulfovibrio TaxID=47054 RepID=A0ABS9EP88_9BACT|nr:MULTISPECIES: NFACT family protein [Dethiosulfovibrio]MCF4142081.1 NFACT family protein [Dethiosulfovibrio marinus]
MERDLMGYGPELVRALSKELSSLLEGKSISKIEGGKDWILFRMRDKNVFVSWGQENFGMTLLSTKQALLCKELKPIRGGLPLALNKYLSGGRIKSIRQEKMDRVIAIDIRRFVGAGIENEYTVTIELMGRLSNVILLDREGTIIEPARHVHPDVNRYRSVLPGQTYVSPPPVQGISPDGIERSNVIDYLKKPIGIGKKLSKSLLIEIERGSLTQDEVLSDLKKTLNGEGIIQDIGDYTSIWPRPLESGKVRQGGAIEIFRRISLWRALEQVRFKLVSEGKKKLSKRIKSLDRHIEGVSRQLKMIDEAGAFRIKGEAILSNLHMIPSRTSEIELPYWDEEGREVRLSVKLNPDLSPSANAAIYFKKYKKYSADEKSVLAHRGKVLKEKEDMEAELDNLSRIEDIGLLRQMVSEISGNSDDARKDKRRKKNKEEKEPPYIRYDFQDSLILVGLNERGNRHVTFRMAGPDDIWFHIHEMPGSHVILKTPPKDQVLLDTAIRICASLSVYYSKGAKLPSSSVDYTSRKHVRHIQGAGPAQVTYKNSDSITVNSDLWRELLREPTRDHEEERNENS